MLKYLILTLFILPQLFLAQVITTNPEFPTENDSIVVFFHASEGDAGLMGYTGNVYTHTGVNTNLGNWQHVIGSWGDDIAQPKLTLIYDDFYKLDIGYPRDFYNVTNPSEKISSLNFVFRSAGADGPTGRDVGGNDVFLNLFEEGLNVKITKPDNEMTFVKLGEQLNITATANLSDSLKLYYDNTLLSATNVNEINYTLDVIGNGKKWIIATAQNDSTIIVDSALIFVRTDPIVSNIPSGTIDGINYIDANTVTLNLFAPDKEFVYVIGDFNNWEVDTNFQMNKTPNDSTFWITLEDLTPQKEYGFQYFVDGNIRIADPYTEKTLDPNDQYISEDIYPDLMTYPYNKTSNIASIFQTNKTEYVWTNETFTKSPKTDLVIYELWLRNFLEEHNYLTLIDTLDYLDNLGINVIELMPINEFEGNDSWGYNPSFYFATDKNYGPSEDLKKFIDECHTRGIAVIIDMVINHSYGQSPLVRLYWDSQNSRPAANNPWYNVSHNFENSDAHWGSDFNHESPYTQQFFDRVNKYWIEEFKVDGFRFDFTKGIGNNFKSNSSDNWGSLYDQDRIDLLKRMVDFIWSIDSTNYVIFEHLADNSEEKVLADYGIMLWGNMNHNYNEATMGYNQNGGSDLSWGYYKNRNWTDPNLVTYMESHDEEKLMYKNLQYGNSSGNYSIKDINIALNRIKLASAFFYTIPGPKMIWQFGELGFDYSINYPSDCRLCLKPFVWNYMNDLVRSNLYKTTQALIKLRTENDAFRSEKVTLNVSGAAKRIKLTHESMNVIVIGNFDVVEKSIIPSFHRDGIWYDFFSGDSIDVINTQFTIPLAPGEFHIYTSEKLPTPEPDILLDIKKENEIIPQKFEMSQNYPNPFNPTTTIKFSIPNSAELNSPYVELKVYDILGSELTTLVNERLKAGNYEIQFDADKYSSGIYFYTISAGEFHQTRKMILLK